MQKYYQQVYIKKYENIYKNTYYMIFQVKYSSTWDERGGLDRWSVFRLKAVWFVYKDVSFVARKNCFREVSLKETPMQLGCTTVHENGRDWLFSEEKVRS